jgi:hypothetical protein
MSREHGGRWDMRLHSTIAPAYSEECAGKWPRYTPHIERNSNNKASAPPKGKHVATKERLAAMAASLCAVCSGAMVFRFVEADPGNSAMELRTYVCAECGHSGTYRVDGGDG